MSFVVRVRAFSTYARTLAREGAGRVEHVERVAGARRVEQPGVRRVRAALRDAREHLHHELPREHERARVRDAALAPRPDLDRVPVRVRGARRDVLAERARRARNVFVMAELGFVGIFARHAHEIQRRV